MSIAAKPRPCREPYRTSGRGSLRGGVFLAMLSGIVFGPQSLAQSSIQSSDPRALRPVEQGVADTGPLSANRRVVPLDLRVPSGFDRVYQFGPSSSGKFARRSGGITAVFSRSTYAAGPSGSVPEIPPGTVFYVGKLPDTVFGGGVGGIGARSMPRSSASVDTSALVSARPPMPRPQTARQPDARDELRPLTTPAPHGRSTSGISIFNDERFRRRRVEGLLDRALLASEDSKSEPATPERVPGR